MPAGEQRVVWSYDPDMDGVSGTAVKDTTIVTWR